jgi:hypothetical protein
MAILPVRDLGSVGVITDVAPYNVPISGFTTAMNVRFDEGKVRRAPIFRTVKDSLGFSPRHAVGVVPATGYDTVVMVSDAYAIHEYNAGTVSNRSGSISGSSDPRPFTSTQLADVVYINRPDRVPAFRGPADTNFQDLTNWPSNYRATALRGFGDFLVALNTTEGSTNFPNRVRFSNLVQANSIPDSWDETDTTKSAGTNDLVEMKTGIVDGAVLGSNFIIYSSDSIFLMEFTGGAFVMGFRKLFTDAGLINQNCVVEVDGRHYCFGPQDIFVHDGTTKQSICDERVKDFIYQGLNNNKANVCFVQHNVNLNEIYFCYQSADQHVAYPNADRCNRAACFNTRNSTWSFIDLPNVSFGTTANVNSVSTYATATSLTYNLVGSSFFDQEDNFDRHTLMVGEDQSTDGITSDKLYGIDLADEGKMSFPVDAEATKPPLLERTGIDLDEAGSAATNYTVVTRLYPQADTRNNSDTTLTFQFGASDIPRDTPTYGSTVTFNIATDHKIDSRAAGRYLSYKMTLGATDYKDFELSGFDIDVTQTGAR